MNSFIEYDLEDGNSILIETGNVPGNDTVFRGTDRGEKNVTKATKTFSQALDKVKPVADVIVDKFTRQKNKPSAVTVEFGLKFGGETDVFIASASLESHFKISIKWENK